MGRGAEMPLRRPSAAVCARAVVLTLAAAAAASAVACASIIGADFDVRPERDAGGAGDAGIVTLADGLDSPWGIAVSEGYLYVSVRGDAEKGPAGRIVKVPIDGGPLQDLATGLDAPGAQVAVAGGYVYWTTSTSPDGGVFRVHTDGSDITPEAVVTEQKFPIGVAVDGAYVYWTGNGGLWRMKLAAVGTPVPAVEGLIQAIDVPSLIALDGEDVYVTAYGADDGGVLHAPLDGGAPSKIADDSEASGITQAGTEVFYATDRLDGAINYVVKGSVGGHPLSTGHQRPAGMQSDGTSIYWADFAGGSVFRLDTHGGTPMAISTTEESPEMVAVDGEYVYWTNFAAKGSVRRAPKP